MYHVIVDQDGAAANRMTVRSVDLRAEMKEFRKVGIRPIFSRTWIADKDATVRVAGCTTCLCLSALDRNEH